MNHYGLGGRGGGYLNLSGSTTKKKKDCESSLSRLHQIVLLLTHNRELGPSEEKSPPG